LLQAYPDLSILVISMHAQPALIHAMLEAGASGYILKDDFASYRELVAVVHDVASQGIYLSPQALQALGKHGASELSQPLSARQLEALSLCSAYPDATTSQLALKMGIAHSTVRNLLSAAYLKLNVRTRTAAILKAQRMGLIPPGIPLGDSSLLDGS
jgi:DNA-binding NarL/FixJ family response regulator